MVVHLSTKEWKRSLWFRMSPALSEKAASRKQHFSPSTTESFSSALMPSLILHETIITMSITLAKASPSAMKSEHLGQLDEDERAYLLVLDLGEQAKGFDGNAARIEIDWWTGILSKTTPAVGMRFSILSSQSSHMSRFAGPLEEGWLNIMGDIIEDDRVRMNIEILGRLSQPCKGGQVVQFL